MRVKIYCLYWENTLDLLASHRAVTEHFGIEVEYQSELINHGLWMDQIVMQSKEEVVGFLDIDCVPTRKGVVESLAKYARDNKSFVGPAQVANHIPPATHVYAAPSCFFISSEGYKSLGEPSFCDSNRGDVAEEVTYVAEKKGFKYRVLYPSTYERLPSKGHAWRLANYGYYGVGTYYRAGVYHLFESRRSENRDLFIKRAREIVEGEFDESKLEKSGFESVAIG